MSKPDDTDRQRFSKKPKEVLIMDVMYYQRLYKELVDRGTQDYNRIQVLRDEVNRLNGKVCALKGAIKGLTDAV